MVNWHRLDPPELAQACEDAGCLVAQRILGWEDIVTSLHDAAVRGGYQGCLSGLRARIAWAVREAADRWETRRDRAEWDIRHGLRPRLERHEPFASLLAEAERINAAAGHPLLTHEVRFFVIEAMRAQLAFEARQAKQRRRRHA